ncbi:YHS domain-containing protein [Salinilacihabitans rarus]|uniref:YHS domain-containing protein n=1 Tax=Salinilacihabitans rarus TaxID=2961596 RepID=UPI003CCDDF8C
MVTDPVCGRAVTPQDTEIRSLKGGETYSFCSIDCRERFEENTERTCRDRTGTVWAPRTRRHRCR